MWHRDKGANAVGKNDVDRLAQGRRKPQLVIRKTKRSICVAQENDA